MANMHFLKSVSVMLVDFKNHIGKARIMMHGFHIFICLFNCSRNRSIYPFFGNENTAFEFQIFTKLKMFSRKFLDRKSTRLNSSHVAISYAVFCLKKKNK